MSYQLPVLSSEVVQNKRVFLLLDLDAPMSEHGISDTTRIDAGFPTLEFLLKNAAQVVIGSKLGRPNGFDKNLSLRGIGQALSARLEGSEHFKEEEINSFKAFRISEKAILLENLRFYKEEEANDLEFAKKLASFADVFVNEQFAVSHRNYASMVGVPKFLPHFAGFRLQKEVEELSKVLENPERPLVVVIGGAKIETKLPLVNKMQEIADKILVGGEIAAQISKFEKPNPKIIVADLNIEKTDITENSIQVFASVLAVAKTVVWNGPMGQISKEVNKSLLSEIGTEKLAQIISQSSAHTIVGGGDTVGFLNKHGLLHNFSFVSTGGGAMLAFLSGEKLPGLEALTK